MGERQSNYTRTGDAYDAIIVGAGVAGLYQLYRLREMGLKVKSFDAASDVAGTWYWNCYPGARVDSQSYIYQYWFSDELINEWDWSERFPAQPETERYLNFVADKLELRKDIKFNTRVTSADWDDEASRWVIRTDKGDNVSAQFLISCTGMLSAPKVPPFPGHDKFRGQIAHTARYPREGIDFLGKKVGVIGTGATGIQVIQTIADQVDQLTIFQRTAQYGVPMRNYKFDDKERTHWREKAHELKERVQQTFTGFDFDVDNGSWHDYTKAERREILEKYWADGSLAMWTGTFPEILFEEEANAEVSEFAREKIRARIKDPAVADLVVPTEYGFGTYRVPLENGFYDVFNQDNVQVVDVKTTPIERFTEKGLIVGDKEYELDVVILATGFDAGTGSLSQMNIRGKDGRSLTAEWKKDIRSTLGLQVAGYPNLFTVAGPLAPSTAFCNMTTCLQQQVDWVTDCIAYLHDKGRLSIEPTPEKQDEWVQHHDETSNATLLVKTKSWYTGANIEGKPTRLLSYIGGVGKYRSICQEVTDSEYEGFTVV